MEVSRIFADHYQFYLYDSDYDHYSDDRLIWGTAEPKEFGYLTTEYAIYVKTVSDLNDHRVRVYINQSISSSYEQVFESSLEINSGKLVVSAPVSDEEDDLIINIEPGKYKVRVCGNSLGKDMFSFDTEYDEEMEDSEYFKHDEFENYDIYLSKFT